MQNPFNIHCFRNRYIREGSVTNILEENILIRNHIQELQLSCYINQFSVIYQSYKKTM